MKVHATAPIESFIPVCLTITLETQQEVAEFHSLFNYGGVSEAVPHIKGCIIREAIHQQTSSREGYPEAFDRVCNVLRRNK